MQLGVFIPIGNNGWLISTTSPQYMPSFDLNRTIVEKAEKFGFDFALSMIKLHGFGGPSQFWDHNLESFTLMAGLAAVTKRIQLFATCAVLTMPPPIAARMAVTIDSIAPGRFGLNIISGWQRAEYTQMGIWPGAEHYKRRYEYCAEYVTIMKELWATGRSDFKGDFFQMDDCRMKPMPQRPIKIVCAAQSDAGIAFAARYGDYNFSASLGGVNKPTSFANSVARLMAETQRVGRPLGVLVVMMIIAEETDEAAMAKWELYKRGTDMEALAWRDYQAGLDKTTDPYATANRLKLSSNGETPPTNHTVLVGSYATVARLMDEAASVPGVTGIMLTFDEFVSGIEKFGKYVQPLMHCRQSVLAAA
jgi:pyrimidine oxygenase